MFYFLSVLTVLAVLYLMLLVGLAIAHHKIFGKRFTPDPNIINYNEKEFGCFREEVNFKIKKYNIKGAFITPETKYDENKIIVFCHGLDSSKESYMQDISTIASSGFQVFCFDYIGVYESEGKRTGGFANGLRCVDYAIKFLHNTYPNKEIYVMGHSWGGFTSINSLKYNKYVKKVCAISPFISINDIFYSLAPVSLKLFMVNMEIIEGLKYGKYAFANSINTLKKYDGKVLIIHSKDDPLVKYNDSTKIMEEKLKDKDNIKFIIVDGKKHNPHYSDAAVLKLNELYAKLPTLNKEEWEAYAKTLNFHELGELDKNIMNQIVEFFKN